MQKPHFMAWAAALLLSGSIAQAAIVTVSKNASDNAQASTINAALDLAASGDTIRILDSATYSENFPLPFNKKPTSGTILDSLTVEAAAGQTPTLERNAGSGQAMRLGPADATSTVTGPFIVRGASPTAKMTIRNAFTNVPVLNTGPNTLSAHSLTLQNLILEKPTDAANAGSSGIMMTLNNAGTHTVTDVKLVGRKDGEVANILVVSSPSTTTFTNVDLGANGTSAADAAYANRLSAVVQVMPHVTAGGTITFNNCSIAPSASALAGATMALYRDDPANASKVVFNDCTFNTGGKAGAYGPRAFETNSDVDLVLNRPVFASGLGDVGFNIGATNGGAADKWPSLTLTGTPASKLSLDSVLNNVVLLFRSNQGTVKLVDVTATVRSPFNALMDNDANSSPLVGDVNVILDRCIFANGAGHFIGLAKGGDFKYNITATNTIWYGVTTDSEVLSVSSNGTTNTAGGDISLTHCTVAMNTNNAFFFGDGNDKSHLYLEGTIIATTKITTSHVLSSIPYVPKSPHIPCITYANVADDGAGKAFIGNPMNGTTGNNVAPAGTWDLVVDPKLSATGTQTAQSPGAGFAANSTLVTVDVDGEARPNPTGTYPDIGADETAAVPVELSTFSAE